jgi:hypothetical protein
VYVYVYECMVLDWSRSAPSATLAEVATQSTGMLKTPRYILIGIQHRNIHRMTSGDTYIVGQGTVIATGALAHTCCTIGSAVIAC